jgi:hypothetical protein
MLYLTGGPSSGLSIIDSELQFVHKTKHKPKDRNRGPTHFMPGGFAVRILKSQERAKAGFTPGSPILPGVRPIWDLGLVNPFLVK